MSANTQHAKARKDSFETEVDGIGHVALGGAQDLTMDEFADWVDAEKEGRIRDARVFLSRITMEWELESDPKDTASFGALTLSQYRGLSQAVAGYLSSIGKN